jgi:hypothetical protein
MGQIMNLRIRFCVPAYFPACFLAVMAAAIGQQVVAPTPEPVGKSRGEDWQGYNIVNSFETGYRFHTVGGNLDKYRSDINFGNGVRLLGGSLSLNSKDGQGRFFDEMLLTTQGLGNDPYESASFRIQKNGMYRYDLLWRENAYFNPGLTTANANGQHLLDTNYGMQDHDLTFFPQGRLKFFLGYTHTSQTGPGISTEQLFDSRGNEFPLFTNIQRNRNEYRVGNEFAVAGIRVNWMHGWEDFKEDTRFDLSGLNRGNNPTSTTTLTQLHRREPIHGTSPYWRVALFTNRRVFNVNGRFTYTGGQRGFVLDESAVGTARFGATNRQVISSGNARRPVATGNLTLSLSPTSKLTIINHTSVYNVRTEGDSVFLQFDNFTLSQDFLYFQYLGIRTIANETDLNYQATRWFGAYAGYHYSNRRIRSIEQFALPNDTPDITPSEQTNQLSSGILGFRLRPAKPLTITFDGEVGRADQPYSPTSERDYHVIGARVQYKLKSLQFSAFTRANYNFNSVSLSNYSSRARTYSGDVSWSPRTWFALDAGYSKNHLNTVGGLAYFVTGNFIQGEKSLYFSNIHSGNFGARFAMSKRVDLYAGYTRVQDVGDGRSDPFGAKIGSTLPAFQAAQTFPLSFQSPLARLSLRITEKMRWNAGYQYYGYKEDFYNRENYRAHTGYTGVLWSF